MVPVARTSTQRKQDTLRRLEQDVDLWVATAAERGGMPYLIPLSFLWDGAALVVSTPRSSPTARNLLATGKVRLGLGSTRDVVLIEGTANAIPAAQVSAELGDAFAARCGFDPRELTTPYTYFHIRPRRILAWREANELEGRELMCDGDWLAADT
jgi:nitroimidazol reductase NimA-like FMN-containing flavoprotein (pyridoxamine 5'-phosphate oxidase superfamily)